MGRKPKKLLNQPNVLPSSSTNVSLQPVKEANKVADKVVSSKIEHTTPLTSSSTVVTRIQSALDYRSKVSGLGEKMCEFATRISEGNMLNAKLSLWEAIRLIERQMREKGV